jgi:hypothetical protein
MGLMCQHLSILWLSRNKSTFPLTEIGFHIVATIFQAVNQPEPRETCSEKNKFKNKLIQLCLIDIGFFKAWIWCLSFHNEGCLCKIVILKYI